MSTLQESGNYQSNETIVRFQFHTKYHNDSEIVIASKEWLLEELNISGNF